MDGAITISIIFSRTPRDGCGSDLPDRDSSYMTRKMILSEDFA